MPKYRFAYKDNPKVVVEMEAHDVAEMVRNAHDWICLDDVSRVLLGDAADVVPTPPWVEPKTAFSPTQTKRK